MRNVSMIPNRLDSMAPSHKLKMYGQLLLRAQRHSLKHKFSSADKMRKDAEKILLHFETTMDVELKP